MAAKRGRPPKGEESRTKTVNMRLSEGEYERVRAACDALGMSLGDFVVAAADRQLRKAKKL